MADVQLVLTLPLVLDRSEIAILRQSLPAVSNLRQTDDLLRRLVFLCRVLVSIPEIGNTGCASRPLRGNEDAGDVYVLKLVCLMN